MLPVPDQRRRQLGGVEALPNTLENLRLRALAIGVTTNDTDDLANLDLGELSAHANGIVGRLVRQVLACVMTEPIAPTVPSLPVEPTPFRIAHDRYVAAREAFEPMRGDATVPAWAAAEREFLEAAEAVDAMPAGSWAEFADAFLCACDDGGSGFTDQARAKLLADVRLLKARALSDPSGWGEPHMGWLIGLNATRAIIDADESDVPEDAPEYQAALGRLSVQKRRIIAEPARSREAVLAKLYTAARISSEGFEPDTNLMIALVQEAEAAFGLAQPPATLRRWYNACSTDGPVSSNRALRRSTNGKWVA